MKTLITCMLLIVSIGLSAQELIIEQLKSDLERSKKMTLAYINAMPEDKLTETPGEGSRTFAQQILHLSQGMFNLSSNGFGVDRPYAEVNLENDSTYYDRASLLTIAEESHGYLLKNLSEIDTSTLDEVIEKGPFQVTRLGWIMKSMEHTTHHRGQCATYFRVFGMPAPRHQLF